jgi:osmotically-inducible protein OsmY
VVFLRGRLASCYLKQVAQEIAAGAAGVRHVINAIDVSTPPERAPVGRGRGD